MENLGVLKGTVLMMTAASVSEVQRAITLPRPDADQLSRYSFGLDAEHSFIECVANDSNDRPLLGRDQPNNRRAYCRHSINNLASCS